MIIRCFNHVQSQKNITSNLGVNRSSPFKTGTTSIINIDGGFLFQNELLCCHLHQERNSTLCWPCLGADPYKTSLQLGAGRLHIPLLLPSLVPVNTSSKCTRFSTVLTWINPKALIALRIFTMDPGHGQDLCRLIAETLVHLWCFADPRPSDMSWHVKYPANTKKM